MIIIDDCVLTAFKIYLQEREYTPATIEKYLRDVRALIRFCGETIRQKTDLIAFKDHLIEQGYAAASINSMLASINSLLVFCEKPEWKIRYLKIQRTLFLKKERELSQEEYMRMLSAAQKGKYDEIFFLDDDSQKETVLGKCADFSAFADDNTVFYPAFGNNEGRILWLKRLSDCGYKVATLIHPNAYVSPTARVADGCVILPQAIVNTDCEVKMGCIVNCGAIVDHGCVLEEGVHVCLGAIVKAENRIPRCMKVEAGEIIANRTYPV